MTIQCYIVADVLKNHMENIYHNNLCCLIQPQIICEVCDFKVCRECDIAFGYWTMKTHNPVCTAEFSNWEDSSMTIRMYYE
jgi:hypothetical protein